MKNIEAKFMYKNENGRHFVQCIEHSFVIEFTKDEDGGYTGVPVYHQLTDFSVNEIARYMREAADFCVKKITEDAGNKKKIIGTELTLKALDAKFSLISVSRILSSNESLNTLSEKGKDMFNYIYSKEKRGANEELIGVVVEIELTRGAPEKDDETNWSNTVVKIIDVWENYL